jgi:hypothetical protein
MGSLFSFLSLEEATKKNVDFHVNNTGAHHHLLDQLGFKRRTVLQLHSKQSVKNDIRIIGYPKHNRLIPHKAAMLCEVPPPDTSAPSMQ